MMEIYLFFYLNKFSFQQNCLYKSELWIYATEIRKEICRIYFQNYSDMNKVNIFNASEMAGGQSSHIEFKEGANMGLNFGIVLYSVKIIQTKG